MELTQTELRALFIYYPQTGLFLNKRTGNITVGSSQGRYKCFKINGKSWAAHRLAWLYMMGSFPEKQIDHINRDAADNRFANLREATGSQNRQNSISTTLNSSGYRGVSWNKKLKKWRAMIRIKPVHFYIGDFANVTDAAIAYNYHVVYTRGEFAAIRPIHTGYLHD